MYANFYDKKNKCLFSVEVNSEHQATHLADKIYASNKKVTDWTITDKPIGRLEVY